MSISDDWKIAIIGMGYVGLPVALAFSEKFQTIGYDVDESRIRELHNKEDRNLEYGDDLRDNSTLRFTAEPSDLAQYNVYIVAVPTPVDDDLYPNFSCLESASETVGRVLKPGDVVIFESTVYPGATREICLPVLERISGLHASTDFKVGYSPERINPGDKERRFKDIKKITSGIDPVSAEIVANLYNSVLNNKVFQASSMEVAEAAKLIENTQRDLNIALMNELALIFDRMGIRTLDVIEAASSKWNFQPFKPGLVGGHCISVDPYYLTYKAQLLGYFPQVVLSGRRVNNEIGRFIAQKTIKGMIQKDIVVSKSIVTILGFAFKEDCSDTRNSKVFDIIKELKDYNIPFQVADPLVSPEEVYEHYGVRLVSLDALERADAIIVATAHSEFKKMKHQDFARLSRAKPWVFDVKGILPAELSRHAEIDYCQL